VILLFTQIQSVLGDWHQYDGVVRAKQELGVFKDVWNTFTGSGNAEKELNGNYAIFFAEESLPQIFKTVLKGNESFDIFEEIAQLNMLLFGLNKMYVEDLQCWRNKADLINQVSV